MSKKDQKQELTQKLGMEFNEAAELFSEETLSSMQMSKLTGEGGLNGTCENTNCPTKNSGICINWDCKNVNCPPCNTTTGIPSGETTTPVP